MLCRLKGGKGEAFTLYGAAFMLCSFRATFLLLAILSHMNPEQAKGKAQGLDGTRQQRLLCSRCGEGGSVGSGVINCMYCSDVWGHGQ